MNFNNSLPIYSQIVEMFMRRVVSGEYEPGGRVAPVRELAEEFGVNPNTMQRALALLEQEGLLRAERTSGRYVTGDTEKIADLKRTLLEREASRFTTAAAALGCTREQALQALEKILS